MQIQILRLGHRLPRDERISTHVALVARAFGASSIFYSGQHDSGLELSVSRITDQWGKGAKENGDFSIEYIKNPIPFIKKKKKDGFAIVHLTMYGLPINQKLNEIRKLERVIMVVGSEQVPAEIYHLADFNISITNQPHSEVAALAIALDRILDGKAVAGGIEFGGKVEIEPKARGKSLCVINQKK